MNGFKEESFIEDADARYSRGGTAAHAPTNKPLGYSVWLLCLHKVFVFYLHSYREGRWFDCKERAVKFLECFCSCVGSCFKATLFRFSSVMRNMDSLGVSNPFRNDYFIGVDSAEGFEDVGKGRWNACMVIAVLFMTGTEIWILLPTVKGTFPSPHTITLHHKLKFLAPLTLSFLFM